jgi:2-oxoglutarate ferredoxin oxidoreductase subunit alpha
MTTELLQEQQGLPSEVLQNNDVTIMIGGQGGDGTLTVVNLLGRAFRNIGLFIYDSRNVLSRIRGGHADGVIRASTKPIYCIADNVDVLVAFDEEAVEAGEQELSNHAIIVFDSSKGPLDPNYISRGYTVYNAPLGNLASQHLRKNIFKNTIAFAILGRLMGLEDSLLEQVLRARYERKGKEALEANLKALSLGFEYCNSNIRASSFKIARLGSPSNRILSTGNEAVAFGFLAGGGRFFVGYPITPATDIMEWLAPRLPKFGGVVKQAEDELAVINMGLGAAYAGARTMVATSGPGQSLMTEGVGHAGEAEIPIVIVQCQRVGPSTGEPTKNEQSDIYHVVFGSHGEFPRIVIAPGTASECFKMTVDALNIAEKYQLPVFILMDQALCQNSESIEPFDLSSVKIERGKLLSQEQLDSIPLYKRYEQTEDGVSPRTIPSLEGGQSQVTGNEHNEFGLVSTDRTNRFRIMHKRMKKLEAAKKDLPRGVVFGPSEAKIGLIGFGSNYGPILESLEQLQEKGFKAKFYQIRTIWPLLEEDLQSFVDTVDTVFVVENNYNGQLASLIKSSVEQRDRIQSICKFDGTSFKPNEITRAVLSSVISGIGA